MCLWVFVSTSCTLVFSHYQVRTLIGRFCHAEMSADIKDYYPNKTVTLIQSRDRLMDRFHPKLHRIVSTRFKELGVEAILSDRVKVPEGGFSNDGSRFDVETMSGRKGPADFIVSVHLVLLQFITVSLSPHRIGPNNGHVVQFQLPQEHLPILYPR